MPLPSHKVTICGIPELPQHSSSSVTHVLSIIDTHEPSPTALEDFYGIHHLLIRFDDVVAEYPGFEACTPQHIEKVLAFGELVHATKDSHVLIHCHAGISRS
ncbi:MAG: dual specificity protein phosphatase family protein, partial [Alphaproteobacteria bacterium]|nr:dual specificity protein phosphatase family protein [Alphaproteobacteria bacterium]